MYIWADAAFLSNSYRRLSGILSILSVQIPLKSPAKQSPSLYQPLPPRISSSKWPQSPFLSNVGKFFLMPSPNLLLSAVLIFLPTEVTPKSNPTNTLETYSSLITVWFINTSSLITVSIIFFSRLDIYIFKYLPPPPTPPTVKVLILGLSNALSLV